MADSDSVDSSAAGAECDSRLHRMSTDKQTPNKSKSTTAGAPQIGASYLVRRLDDTCRKSLPMLF